MVNKDGAGIIGPVASTPSHPGAMLTLHLSRSGFATADNEFVAAIFKVGDPHPAAVLCQPIRADRVGGLSTTWLA
jgi:hypothetical protein